MTMMPAARAGACTLLLSGLAMVALVQFQTAMESPPHVQDVGDAADSAQRILLGSRYTTTAEPSAGIQSWWPADSWKSLAVCQLFLLCWIFVELVIRPRVMNYVRRQNGNAKTLKQAWDLVSFLVILALMYATRKINEEHSPKFWWGPIALSLGFAFAIYYILRRFFPDMARKIFAVQCVSEEIDDGTVTEETIESLPGYWTNKKLRKPVTFDQRIYVQGQTGLFGDLLKACYEPIATADRACPKAAPCPRKPGGCPCVQPGGTPGLPTAYVARRVVRNENSEMWQRYDAARTVIRDRRAGQSLGNFDPAVKSNVIAGQNPDVFEPLDESINEAYLFHGTSVRTALNIAQNDFRIDLAGSNQGTMYGKGAYLCESSTKCDEYAKDDPGGYYEGIRAIVLSRVVMGKFYYTQDRNEQAGEKVTSGEFDSTLGDRAAKVGTFREFVVYDQDQVYPEYVILYSRAHGEEEERKLVEVAKCPFLMELPLYWTNCHLNAAVDVFDQEFRVRDSSKDIIQQLANGTRASGNTIDVVEVIRMEDCKMWTNYVQFKNMLKSRGNSKAETVGKSDAGGDCEKGNATNTTACVQLAELDQGPCLTEDVLGTLNAEDSISLEQIDHTVNEVLVWHGSSEQAITAIGQDGFMIPREGKATHGKRFGEGAYLAEDLDKSLQYTTPDSDGFVYFLLCRAVLGEVYVTTANQETTAHTNALENGKNSVLACPPGGAREFIVMEERQVYPEFVVKMRP